MILRQQKTGMIDAGLGHSPAKALFKRRHNPPGSSCGWAAGGQPPWHYPQRQGVP